MTKCLVALVVAGSMAMAASAGAADRCVAKADAQALSTRLVQTELMVAALSCDASQRYNAFVRKYQADLVAGNKRMLRFFQSRYGAQGTKRNHDFVTRTANESSERSLRQIDDFCAAATRSFDRADSIDRRQFAAFVQEHPVAVSTGFEICPSPEIKTARQASPAKKRDPA